jgi:chromosome segregation ATPase
MPEAEGGWFVQGLRAEMLAGFARLEDAVAALADQQGAAAVLQTRLEEAASAHTAAMGCQLSEVERLREQVANATNETAALRAEMAEQKTEHAAALAEKDQLAADLHASQDKCVELAGALAAANASRATEQAASGAQQEAAEGLRAALLACQGELGAARQHLDVSRMEHQPMAAEREARARSEAEALQATDSAEVPHPAFCKIGSSYPFGVSRPEFALRMMRPVWTPDNFINA